MTDDLLARLSALCSNAVPVVSVERSTLEDAKRRIEELQEERDEWKAKAELADLERRKPEAGNEAMWKEREELERVTHAAIALHKDGHTVKRLVRLAQLSDAVEAYLQKSAAKERKDDR